jgi:hypothetical protein
VIAVPVPIIQIRKIDIPPEVMVWEMPVNVRVISTVTGIATEQMRQISSSISAEVRILPLVQMIISATEILTVMGIVTGPMQQISNRILEEVDLITPVPLVK